MENKLKILFVEDVPTDVELAKRTLNKEGIKFKFCVVENETDFIRELEKFVPDIVISDYSMPQFDGMRALKITLEKNPNTPFILLTGSINEVTAVKCLKAGATDYIIKENITRLPFAVNEALEKTKISLEKEKAEKTLKESEEKYRLLLESSGIGVALYSLDGRILLFNDKAAKNMGGKAEDFIGKSLSDFFSKETVSEYLRRIQLAVINETSQDYEDFAELPSGDYWFLSNHTKVLNTSGEVIGVQVIAHDVTERKLAEEALRQERDFSRTIVQTSPTFFVAIGSDGKTIMMNDSMLQTIGYTLSEVVGMDYLTNFIPVEDREKLSKIFEALVTTNLPTVNENPILTKDGRKIIVEWHGKNILKPNGELNYFFGIGIDITERKRIESVLADSETKFKWLFEYAPVAYHVLTPDGIITDVNARWCENLGYTKDEVCGKPIFDFVLESERSISEGLFKRKILSKSFIARRNERNFVAKDGLVKTFLINDFVTLDKQEKIVSVQTTMEDITERRRTEELQAKERNLLQTLIDNLPDYIYAKDTQGRFILGNTAVVHQMGLKTQDELVGKTDFDFFPRDLAEQYYADEQKIIQSGKGLYNFEGPTQDMGKQKWISTTKVLLRDSQGNIEGFVGLGHDITKRKLVEAELLASREAERNFNERLTILSETTTELSKAESLDELCRRAVELCRERLHFDRPSIWFVTEDSTAIQGTFGVDVDGRITDERGERYPAGPDYDFWPVIQGQVPLLRLTDAPLALKRQDVGKGTHIIAGLFDGNTVIGYISIDNLLRQHPFSDSDCEIIRLYASAVGHLCSLKRTQEGLRTSEERFVKSFNSNPIATIISILPEGWMLDVNEAFLSLSGYSREEVIGKTGLELNLWANPEDSNRLSLGLIEKHSLRNIESQLLTKSGESKHILTSAEIINIANQPHGLIMFSDITERKRMEEKVRESEERFRMVFENVFDGISIYTEDPDPVKRILIDCNEQYAAMAGRSRDELLKLGSTKGLQITHEHNSNDLRLESVNKGTEYHGSFSWIRPDGKENIIEYVGVPVTWHDQSFTIGIDHDITERKKIEEALNYERYLLKSLMDNTFDHVYFKDLESRFIRISKAQAKAFGLSDPAQAVGKTDFDLFTEEHARPAYEAEMEIIKTGRPVVGLEEKETWPDGRVTWVLTSKVPLRDSSGAIKGTFGISTNITERKRAEEEITMLAHSLKSINECVSITDLEDKILFVNESYLKTYGYDENELIGKHVNIVRSLKNPPELVKKILPSTLEGGWQGELWNIRKNGSEFLIHLSTTVIYDKDGKAFGLIGVATDITERKRDEKELIEAKEKAEQSDKLKSEFLAQMSHEIRTPLNAIVGNVEYLNGSFGKKMDSDTRDCFDGIDLASRRIIRTVDLILNAAELQTSGYKPHFVKIDLTDVLDKLYQEHLLSAKQKGLELIYVCEVNETYILADEYSITQIFANLMDNAIKYTIKGKVEILLGKNNMGNIIVEVKDTGIGISKEFLPRIFEPFTQEDQGFTRSFEGNGLGLALVKGYCELNNAIIEVESEKDVGSTFRVIFD